MPPPRCDASLYRKVHDPEVLLGFRPGLPGQGPWSASPATASAPCPPLASTGALHIYEGKRHLCGWRFGGSGIGRTGVRCTDGDLSPTLDVLPPDAVLVKRPELLAVAAPTGFGVFHPCTVVHWTMSYL